MEREILSVGIDFGTTTSQVIFSRICLENISYTAIPEVRVKSKEIFYKSGIYFTPLNVQAEIDISVLKDILTTEYSRAGVQREEISTGAMIITGETARKGNAELALHGLSADAGDFVVAEAGPDLESVLAGYGAGTADISRNLEGEVINFDIGGGTTNAAAFCNGDLEEAFALDIGGRLIRFDESMRIEYISLRLEPLLKQLNLKLRVGEEVSFSCLKKLTDALAEIILRISRGEPLLEAEQALFIAHGIRQRKFSKVMFSGGVAECIYADGEEMTNEWLGRFNDIGPLLGVSIRQYFQNAADISVLIPKEKIRATVIGAGGYSVKLSGSTVITDDSCVPLKNIPVVHIENPDSSELLHAEYMMKRRLYPSAQQVAIAFSGITAPGYQQLRILAQNLAREAAEDSGILLVLVEYDFAKALGLLLHQYAEGKRVICLDSICARDGDYVDVGQSVAGIVPVAVKTLIFES
jgi:ethanolamine utilization protein EutA